MNFDTVKLAYFSPTGTTRKILGSIAEGLGAANIQHIDLTLPQTEAQSPGKLNGELVFIGLPVYEGRAAKTALERLSQLKADNTPAAIVVLYGNRDFEDALIELYDLTREWGFLPLAAGAFIGEHSFARDDRPMANGRPDAADIAAAKEFGQKIRAKLEGLSSASDAALVEPPGNRPYIDRDRSPLADRAATTLADDCTLCGTCASVCPVGAVTVDEAVVTDNMACILCNACVKNCPTGARVVDDPMINKIVAWVCKNTQERREPVTFV